MSPQDASVPNFTNFGLSKAECERNDRLGSRLKDAEPVTLPRVPPVSPSKPPSPKGGA